MKYLIPLILLFPSLVLAADDVAISEIDVKASSANSKADSNNSRIQALEAEDIILHGRIDTVESDLAAIELTPRPKGDKGDTGDTGPQGPPGNLGLAGMACPSGEVMVGFDLNGNLSCATLSSIADPTVPIGDVTGNYNVTPTPAYTCAFGAVNFNITSFAFQEAGSLLTVSGAPTAMTGTITDGNFTVSGTIAGTSPETYTLVGSFTDNDNWTGTFSFTVGGDPFDCTNQMWSVSGTIDPTVPIGDVTGNYNVTPTPAYTCAFGAVNFNITSFAFQEAGSLLTVSGAPTAMTGTITDGNFTVSGTIAGTSPETYTLVGSFTDNDNWTGAFSFTVGGDPFDCANQMWSVSGVIY